MEPEIKSVAHPPGMEDGLDYTVEHGDRRYGFQTPQRGTIVLVSVTRPKSVAHAENPEEDEHRTYVNDETFDGSLPTPVREKIMTYFREEFGDEMTIKIDV